MGLLKKYYNFEITTHFIILLISVLLMWFLNKITAFLLNENIYIFGKLIITEGAIYYLLVDITWYTLLIFLYTCLMCILSKILKNKFPIIGIIIFVISVLYFYNETGKGRDEYWVFYVDWPIFVFSIALLISSIIHLLIKRNK